MFTRCSGGFYRNCVTACKALQVDEHAALVARSHAPGQCRVKLLWYHRALTRERQAHQYCHKQDTHGGKGADTASGEQ